MSNDAMIDPAANKRRSRDRRQGERRIANDSQYGGPERRHNSDFRVAERRQDMEHHAVQA
jgi:hypothetical protein